MSIDRCCECYRLVDTDGDAEFYSREGNDEGMCRFCREELVKAQAEDRRLDDPRRGQAKDINRRME